jgi:hypothetical protein
MTVGQTILVCTTKQTLVAVRQKRFSIYHFKIFHLSFKRTVSYFSHAYNEK